MTATKPTAPSAAAPSAAPAQCPFPHHGQQKTRLDSPEQQPTVYQDADGVYHVHGFGAAREVMRSEVVKQAGFGSEMISSMPALTNPPVLFLEGEAHHEMRRQTARYFTPTTVSGYRRMMEHLADDLVGELVAKGRANLDDLSLRMAVEVAAQVVGLTSSAVPGMAGRIESFVTVHAPPRSEVGRKLAALRQQAQILSFLLLDVKPAIAARRKKPQDDVISHLLSKNYNDIEILTECVTYGTAGMVTTREFITVAAWHLMESPELRREYLHGSETERHTLLLELLRLEPVVGTLKRRATADLTVDGQTIPAGSLFEVHVYDTNADESVVGADPLGVCPARNLPRGVQAQAMSFGDGHHRCPGAYIAIQETDILLRRLLWLPGLKLEALPSVARNPLVTGYELRGLTLSV